MFVWEEVLDLLKSNPQGLTRAQLAGLLGRGKSTAIYHLEKLVDDGLATRQIERQPQGGPAYVYYALVDNQIVEGVN